MKIKTEAWAIRRPDNGSIATIYDLYVESPDRAIYMRHFPDGSVQIESKDGKVFGERMFPDGIRTKTYGLYVNSGGVR